MTILLSREQYHMLWSDKGFSVDFDPTDRINYWNNHHRPTTNLDYSENIDHIADAENQIHNSGYWGELSGEDKDINWFILKNPLGIL